MALLPAVASPDCEPFCFEPVASDILLTGVSGWNTLPVARSRTDGTFTVTNAYVGEFGAWAAHPSAKKLTGDFDGNGWTDVALTGVAGWNTLPIAFANGNGTFTVSNQYIGEFAAWAALPGVVPLVGDFDGNGHSDIALTGHPGWATLPVALSFTYYPGQFYVDNTFIGEFAAWAAHPDAVKLVGDFNADGRSDIALTGVPGWQSVPVAFADAFWGTFRSENVTNYPLSDFAGWAAMPGVAKLGGDFNGDGLSDILLAGGAGWSSLRVAFSDGDGTFTEANVTDPSWGWVGEYVSWPDQKYRLTGDFNGDGRTDVAFVGWVVNEWYSVSWFFIGVSIGDGSFSWEGGYDTSDVWPCLMASGAALITGDFNGDSRTDFAITGGEGWGSIPVLFATGTDYTWFHWTNKPVADFPTWAANPAAVKLSGDFK